MSLKQPSVILKNAGASSFREYASIVYRGLQQTPEHAASVGRNMQSFVSPECAADYENHVNERLDLSLPPTLSEEECIFLPPLFLRSCEHFIAQASSQVYLVCHESGPIIPVIKLRAAQRVMADLKLVDLLLTLYETVSPERATRNNLSNIIAESMKAALAPKSAHSTPKRLLVS